MGKIMILRISIIILKKSTSIKAPPNNFINKGVKIGANNVAQEVMVSDKATLALAIYAITLDAKPLGEDPIKITPAAISGGKLKLVAKKYPIKGMMVNWQISPITTLFGDFTTASKSLGLMVVPIPNMMI